MKSLWMTVRWAAIVCLLNLPTSAQSDAASDAAQANNPLADIRAFNIQNYYIGAFTGPGDFTGNQFVLRYAQPVSIDSGAGLPKWQVYLALNMQFL